MDRVNWERRAFLYLGWNWVAINGAPVTPRVVTRPGSQGRKTQQSAKASRG